MPAKFNWKEYLNVAQLLSDSGQKEIVNKEAAYRSAISRAYYAAFRYAVRYACEKLQFTPSKNREDHERVRNLLKARKMGEVASMLSELCKWREQCDYDDSVENIDQFVKSSMRNANDIFNSLK